MLDKFQAQAVIEKLGDLTATLLGTMQPSSQSTLASAKWWTA
jgi:hypothetical protein